MVAVSPPQRLSILERIAVWIAGKRRNKTVTATRKRGRTPLLIAFALAVFDESISLAALTAFVIGGFHLAVWAGWLTLAVALLVADTAVPAAVRKRRADT